MEKVIDDEKSEKVELLSQGRDNFKVSSIHANMVGEDSEVECLFRRIEVKEDVVKDSIEGTIVKESK